MSLVSVLGPTKAISYSVPALPQSQDLKQLIAEVFPNDPMMLCIAEKESGTKQFYSNGKLVVSPTHDYGLMQINSSWIPTANKLGLDITKPLDNIYMAKHIRTEQGLSAWATYSKCKSLSV